MICINSVSYTHLVSGVVVTDGAHFKTTDAQGNYVLNTDPARYPMVYISTPADYELPSKEGVADGFYQYLDAKKSCLLYTSYTMSLKIYIKPLCYNIKRFLDLLHVYRQWPLLLD